MNALHWLTVQVAGLNEARRVSEELRRLSSRSLADAGLSADDIPTIARDARHAFVAEHIGRPEPVATRRALDVRTA